MNEAILVEPDSPIMALDGELMEALGIETVGGVFTPLIEAGTIAPCERAQIFSTAADNQDAIDIRVFRGTAPMAEDNYYLGRFRIVGIPPAPRGVPQIEVTFAVTDVGIYLSAIDLAHRQEMEIVRLE